MKALAEVDLSGLSGAMLETLEVRLRDIRAEIMGFRMDVENYQGDAETMELLRNAQADGVLPQMGAANTITTKRALED